MPQLVELLGTLNPNGTLVLDEKPSLPVGRVKVILEAIAEVPVKDPWGTMERIWAERKALGLQPRTAEEIDAELAAMRDEWEEHQQSLEAIQAEAQRARESGSC